MIEKFVKGQFTEDDLEQTIIHYFTQQGYGHVMRRRASPSQPRRRPQCMPVPGNEHSHF